MFMKFSLRNVNLFKVMIYLFIIKYILLYYILALIASEGAVILGRLETLVIVSLMLLCQVIVVGLFVIIQNSDIEKKIDKLLAKEEKIDEI